MTSLLAIVSAWLLFNVAYFAWMAFGRRRPPLYHREFREVYQLR